MSKLIIVAGTGFLGQVLINHFKNKFEEIVILTRGNSKTIYRLKDWGISRQRYWGCPIPILYREDGKIIPVPEKDLPVTLPKDIDFNKPGNPLENHPTWKYTKWQHQFIYKNKWWIVC